MSFSHNHFTMASLFIGLLTSQSVCGETPSMSQGKEVVVLIHGLRRTSSSMGKLEMYLSGKGYRTINLDYASSEGSITGLAETYIPDAVSRCQRMGAEKIHFVTHSLGGIIIRQYLQGHSLPNGSRLIMLAPPNQGTEVVDCLKDFFLYKWFNGPAGQELGTGSGSLPKNLKPIDIEVGIIAGNRSLNPIFSMLIPGPDDGKVSVERTKLPEMKDFLVVPSTHTFIMKNDKVLEQVLHFIEHGAFVHNPDQKEGRP